jgi:hypothetical protein
MLLITSLSQSVGVDWYISFLYAAYHIMLILLFTLFVRVYRL